MKNTLVVILVAALFGMAAQSGYDLFQKALVLERTEGKLTEAIKAYKQIAEKYAGDRKLAAKALMQMAQCYERLGHADARRTYEQLLQQYSDQNGIVAEARTRLSALERAGGLSRPAGITLRKVWAIERSWLEGSPSPDGRYHSFHELETGDLALRDLTTGQNRRLTNKGTWEEPREYAEASVISGDGKLIAYAWRNKEKFYELRVCGIDGSNPRTVYRDKEFGHWLEPYQWTPDGKQILAILERKRGEEELAFIPAAGGPVRFLNPPRWWWYANVSPDGRFLVYDAAGEKADESDICLLPLEGGQEVPLVRSPAQDSFPVWMPDGKRVLFVSDRTGTNGLWAIDVVEGKPQGLPQLLKDGVGRAIRPNGFTRRGDFYFSTSTDIGEVYITELDPVDGRLLRPPVPIAQRLVGSNSAPTWSPDGRRLAYYSLSLRDGQRALTLVILSIETGEAKDIPVKLNLSPFRIIWHPSGKSVFVGTIDTPERGLLSNYLVDLQTGDHRLVRSHSRPVPGAGDISPDGKTLFFFTGGEPKLRGGIISCDVETGKQREIARIPDLAAGGFPILRVSPDSKYLALRVPMDGGQWMALRLVPATGGEWRELCRFPRSDFADDADDLAWTPDGSNLLILRNTGKKAIPELWRIPVAGGEPQRTGLSAENMGIVAPHPDGRRIAFESGYRGVEANELWVLENIPAAAKSKAK